MTLVPTSSTERRSRPKKSTGSRRDDLIAIAAEVFAEQGFKATTVRQIGDAAGVLSGSLYHHFESKESILDELLSSYLQQLIASYESIISSDASAREKLEQMIGVAFRSVETHRAAAVVMQNERHELTRLPRFAYLPQSEARVAEIWIAAIEEAIGDGDIRDDLPAPMIYRFLRDAIWVSVRWLRPGGPRSVDEISATYVSLLFDGVGARDSGETTADSQ